VFCGRILFFLAYVYPLSERSGVNVTGAFNTANATVIADAEQATTSQTATGADADADADADVSMGSDGKDAPASKLVDKALHNALWRLQQYIMSPVQATASASAWKAFVSCVDLVLNAFEAQRLESTAARKKKKETADETGATSSASPSDEFYCVKYLTSAALLPLQVRSHKSRVASFVCSCSCPYLPFL